MSELERAPASGASNLPATFGDRMRPARVGRALAAIEQRSVVRMATVQGEGFVEAEKLREIDRLAHTAMSGQAFLRGWVNHLAGDDMVMADELRFYTDLAKLGKGDIIAGAIDRFRRK